MDRAALGVASLGRKGSCQSGPPSTLYPSLVRSNAAPQRPAPESSNRRGAIVPDRWRRLLGAARFGNSPS
jgi:hypothetical protein